MKVVCITNDVEATTIQGDAYSEDAASKLSIIALPEVLELYKKYNVKSTFFCLGQLIEKHPEIINMILADGHEIACHGYSHDSNQAFDMLSFEEQKAHLQKAKSIIEATAKNSIVSFRAPALRVNEYTPKALIESGFSIDSSVASQRLDAFMSLGSKRKLKWIIAPRTVYKTKINDLTKNGDCNITEVPVSAFGLPYISTLMRISPFLTKITRFFLYLETKNNNKKVVTFLFHPGENLEPEQNIKPVRRTKNPISHLLTGVLRTYLKKRNLGRKCMPLLEEQILYWKKKGYQFATIKEITL